MCTDVNAKIGQAMTDSPVDPWQHRSKKMRCSSCMWFVEKSRETLCPVSVNYYVGRCRRHAPSMNGYPAVMSNDWCGDHKVDENKV